MSNDTQSNPTPTGRPAVLWQALFPVLFLVVLLGLNVFLFEGTPHLPLVLSTLVAGLVGRSLGYRWTQLEQGIVRGVSMALQACLILMVVGSGRHRAVPPCPPHGLHHRAQLRDLPDRLHGHRAVLPG